MEVESAVLADEGGELILVLLHVFLNDDVDQYVDDFSQLFDILSKPVYLFQDILVIRQSIPPFQSGSSYCMSIAFPSQISKSR